SHLLLLALASTAAAQSCGRVYYNEQPAASAMALAANLTGAGNATGIQTGEAMVGGYQASSGSWPWVVSICEKDWFGSCVFQGQGAIISQNYVITAATAVTGSKASNYYVRVGTIDNGSGGHLIQVANHWFVANADTYDNICILELGQPIQFNNYAQPICLPANDDGMITPGNTAWFTAWGHSTNVGTIQTNLHQAKMPFVSNNVCSNKYSNFHTNTQICAGGDGVTTCDNDKGGPLVNKKNGVWYLYGISDTHDYALAGCNSATVFSRVTHFCSYISSNYGVSCID
ncbi:hypothetical protein PFISCL1PPCAC_8562, partial [Pristionchus fissidentatus]